MPLQLAQAQSVELRQSASQWARPSGINAALHAQAILSLCFVGRDGSDSGGAQVVRGQYFQTARPQVGARQFRAFKAG